MPDLLVIDPLVAFCPGFLDNGSMGAVMKSLKRLAGKHNCAVLVNHHNRKGGERDNVESVSGAAAITNLARRAIMPVPMAAEEATKFGVMPSERFRYFRLADAKRNLTPPATDDCWYKLESVTLPNAEPPFYQNGDNVQVVTRVTLSAAAAAADPDMMKMKLAVLKLIKAGKALNGERVPYSPSMAGAANSRTVLKDAMAAAGSASSKQWKSEDLQATVKNIIKEMQGCGWITTEDWKGDKKGMGVPDDCPLLNCNLGEVVKEVKASPASTKPLDGREFSASLDELVEDGE
jgi:hypothetical protein